MPEINETGTLPASGAQHGGTMLVQLITPGDGSSGYYSPAVLEAAATDRAFPAGTLMFADHPGETERFDRPERSVRDVAGFLAEDARWDGTALVAEVRTIDPWTTVLSQLSEAIGVSIRADADVTESSRGRRVVNSITRGVSVDFVTHAGRGGRIAQVYESARADAPVIVEHRTETTEAATDDTRAILRAAVRAATGTGRYAWVDDFDPETATVYYTAENNDGESHLYAQTYEIGNDGLTATLTGTPTEVRARTEYVPINPTSPATSAAESAPEPPVAPAGSTPTHESPEEDTMPQIEEARLRQLEEDAGRVQTLTTERDTAVTERDQARADAQAATNTADARTVIAESDHQFSTLEARGLLADLPTTDTGSLDTEAFTTTVNEAGAERDRTAGAGTVTGFGRNTSTGASTVSESDLDGALGITRKGA